MSEQSWIRPQLKLPRLRIEPGTSGTRVNHSHAFSIKRCNWHFQTKKNSALLNTNENNIFFKENALISNIQSIFNMNTSEIDNDAYCVCTHDFSPCTHRNIRPVRTMYAVKISGTQTVYDLMRTQIKISLKLSQNDNLSTSIVRLLCQQSKSSYNMNAASDRFILHTMQYIMYLQ